MPDPNRYEPLKDAGHQAGADQQQPASELDAWEAKLDAKREELDKLVVAGRIDKHEATYRLNRFDNEELARMNTEKRDAPEAKEQESSRELPFFEDQGRNYDGLKQEHAEATTQEQDGSKEQAQGRSLPFNQGQDHDPAHSR